MNKRNYLILILYVCIICICIATGCDSAKLEPYASLIVDSSNDEYSVASECNFWTGEYFKKTNMPEQSCFVLGNSYTGSYEKSIINKCNSYTTDRYYSNDGIEFGLRSDTGKLVYINFMNALFFETEPFLDDIENPQENAILCAEEIAEYYVDNINSYTQILGETVTRQYEKDGKMYELSYYFITYARKIKGYFTSDYITVKMTSKGNVASIMMGDINVFDDNEIEFDISTLEKSIADKIDVTYKDTLSSVKNFNIVDQKIVLTPNGYVCMYSDIGVTIEDENNMSAETSRVILTVIGEK